jgi:triosephosphate isomerase
VCHNLTVAGISQTYIGVSMKAYLGYDATLRWLTSARESLDARPGLAGLGIQAFVAPSTPLLGAAMTILGGSECWVGAQDANWQTGAATGAISMDLLAELGADFVELGHAERYSVFDESRAETRRKADAAARAGLRVLLCIGERSHSEPEAAAAECVLQVRSLVDDGGIALQRVLLAYEPWWAIGAEAPASPDHVNLVVATVRQRLAEELGDAPLGILYGGSAGPGTLAPLVEADGLFLGRFAHDPANFATVLDEAIDAR